MRIMKKLLLIPVGCLILFGLPFVLWWTKPATPINAAIIDKTVPDETFRGHLGITWALNHFRYENTGGSSAGGSGSAKGSAGPFQPARDYYGFVPNAGLERYSVRELPTDLADIDFMYIADTGGVHADDLPWASAAAEENLQEGDAQAETRQGLLYGGLLDWEWGAIERRLGQERKSLLIAEFNTFATPTEEDVRAMVTDHFGLEWSGWTGRFFRELDPRKNPDIPKGIVAAAGDGWTYSGEGFILVNDLRDEVVVLEKGSHFGKGGIRLAFTEQGRERFRLTKSPDYTGWFDIVVPRSAEGGDAQGASGEGARMEEASGEDASGEGASSREAAVLARYEWDLTERGRQLLAELGIPEQFAAVVLMERGSSRSYYFAGNFGDVSSVPGFYKVAGLDLLFRWTQSFSDSAFYWKTYVPMVKAILRSFRPDPAPQGPAPEGDPEALKVPARVADGRMEVYRDGRWVPITIKGVNMGMGKPNHFPGEAAITEEEYYRWFKWIGGMNANVVRVYTLHPPGFYRALKRYNDTHDHPIYVLHGVWINEERLVETLDAYDGEVLADFQAEMKKIADVIHGNAYVPGVPGHASGVYQADISEYVIGWVIGIEWYPHMVVGTNEKHAGGGEYDGTYFYTDGARPFERWLAEQMDLLAAYEREKYGTLRPMSFTNWVTTDLLKHPAEPLEDEDLVSVDPNVIHVKNEMEAVGQFASYHVYPYYPDFMNFEPSYLGYLDHRGEPNTYAAYLRELHAAHRLPILVAEFGVPSSRGLTHVHPFGWNQGFLTEKEQGEILRRLFEDIMAEGLMGGLLFTWQDEWFKRTWNTMDYDNPDRRPYWSNAQTNEQQFGLLSFDRHKIRVDGETGDWKVEPLYAKEDGGQHSGGLRALYVDHDERYLYLRLDADPVRDGYPLILLDVVPDQGNHFIEGLEGISFSNGIDFVIRLDGEESRVLIDPYYDLLGYMYGYQLKMIDPLPPVPTKNSGRFVPVEYVLNRQLYLPLQDMVLPFSTYETGKLREGNGNPDADGYDSLADYYVNGDGTIELRIPWLLIQSRDPSRKEFVGDLYANGVSASVHVDQIFVGALYVQKNGEAADGRATDGASAAGESAVGKSAVGESADGVSADAASADVAPSGAVRAPWAVPSGVVADSLPAMSGTSLGRLRGYAWEAWETAQSEERLKQSYGIVGDFFGRYV